MRACEWIIRKALWHVLKARHVWGYNQLQSW